MTPRHHAALCEALQAFLPLQRVLATEIEILQGHLRVLHQVSELLRGPTAALEGVARTTEGDVQAAFQRLWRDLDARDEA